MFIHPRISRLRKANGGSGNLVRLCRDMMAGTVRQCLRHMVMVLDAASTHHPKVASSPQAQRIGTRIQESCKTGWLRDVSS